MLASLAHPLNFSAGWGMILAAFLTGAGIGLFYHKPEFLGGYTSLRRRMLRLGHIALAALGMLNVLFGISPACGATDRFACIAFIVGGVTMPAVCFLTAWREPFRHLFFIPVISLVAAVTCVLIGGLP